MPLGQRIPDQETLAGEVAAWESERNERGATVDWRFTATDARELTAHRGRRGQLEHEYCSVPPWFTKIGEGKCLNCKP